MRTYASHFLFRALATIAVFASASFTGAVHADSTTVTPGDGPQCVLNAPATASFNTVLQPSLTLTLRSDCTRYPVLWEWTAPPLDYTNRNLTGQNILFTPLFANNKMKWTYDNRKVTATNSVDITFTATGTYTFATRGKDADFIPPNNQPAGFWGPWGRPGANTIDESGAWKTITLTCQPYTETRAGTPGGTNTCTGGRIPTQSETRTFCGDSVTPTWTPWTPVQSCECPVGQTWNGSVCVPVPTCSVAPTPPVTTPGQSVRWDVSCDTPATSVNWTLTTPPIVGVTACASGTQCTQTYPPSTVCYSVQGSNVSGVGRVSSPSCATIACVAPEVWSHVARSCGVPPTITSPIFNVGSPQPPQISVTTTGTPPLTCSSANLPTGWSMSAACALTTSTPSTPMPPVPTNCTVTVTNAWGTDTKPCIEQTQPAPYCQARWNTTPFVLTTTTSVRPRSRDYLAGLGASPGETAIFEGEDQIPVSKTGRAELLITTGNSDTYSINCDGTPNVIASPPLAATTRSATAVIEYARRYAVSPSSYQGYLPVNGITKSIVNFDSNYRWISYTDADTGTPQGLWVYAPVTYSVNLNQAASSPPTNPVCRVTVTQANTGATAQCSSQATTIVDSGTQSYCSLNVSMVLRQWYQQNPVRDWVNSPPADTSTLTDSRDNTSLNAIRSPNVAHLNATLRTNGVQLQSGAYLPPSSTVVGNGAWLLPFNDSSVQCRRRSKTAGNINPAWQPIDIPFAQTGAWGASLASAGSLWPSGGSSAYTLRSGPTIYGAQSNNNPRPLNGILTSWGESIDSENSEYEMECSYTGRGRNNLTGQPETVSCSGWYTYTPGAICQPNVAFSVGASGTLFANGTSQYDGYSAGWKGVVRFLGDKITLKGNDGTDKLVVQSGTGVIPGKPKLQSLVQSSQNPAHVLMGIPEASLPINGGSTRGFLIGNHASLGITDGNLRRAGEVISTRTVGTIGLSETPVLYRGCDGRAPNSTSYEACGHTSVFDVVRTLFPGTTAQRESLAQCVIDAGSTDNFSGTPCPTCGPTGSGTSFGPGSTGGQTGTGGDGGSTGGFGKPPGG
jgi:hypothetical protein